MFDPRRFENACMDILRKSRQRKNKFTKPPKHTELRKSHDVANVLHACLDSDIILLWTEEVTTRFVVINCTDEESNMIKRIAYTRSMLNVAVLGRERERDLEQAKKKQNGGSTAQ